MLFGFDISSISLWVGSEVYRDYFGADSSTQGGITASMSGGSLVGALIAGWIADRWGRRGALMLAAAVFIVGSILQATAQNVGHLIAGRIVNGFSIGITSSQVIVYLSELAPASKRGGIVGIQQWAIEWGILIMYLISYACSQTINNTTAFRIAWGVQAIPALVLLPAAYFFPESPRWLASHDRWEEAHEVLANLHGKGNRQDPVVMAELEEVREAARVAALSKDIGYLGLFTPKVIKQTMVGVSVQVWQQMLGGNVALYYLVYLLNMAGMVSFHRDLEIWEARLTLVDWKCCLDVQHHSICHLPRYHRRYSAFHRPPEPSLASDQRRHRLLHHPLHHWCNHGHKRLPC
jgi:MFS family permease